MSLEAFVEKPDSTTAQAVLDSGSLSSGNSGMFLLRAETYLGAAREFQPACLEAAGRHMAEATQDMDFIRRTGTGLLLMPADSLTMR